MVFVFSAVMVSTAKAQTLGVIGALDAYAGENNVIIDSEVRVQGNATSTVAKEKNDDRDNATSTNEKNDNEKSVVSTFVQALLNVADREGGIGEEVRDIANKQNDSSTTTVKAMVKVDERGSIKELFFGSDYKNLGVIRSELATTTNNIARLKSLVDQTNNAADRAELNIQIQSLEAEQAKTEAYVTDHENIFSFFGWFTKLFAK